MRLRFFLTGVALAIGFGASLLIFWVVLSSAAQAQPACVHYYGQPPCPGTVKAAPVPRLGGSTCWQIPNTLIPSYRCSNGYEWWVDAQGISHDKTVADYPDYVKGSTINGPGKVGAPEELPELNEYTGTPQAYPPQVQR